MYTKYQKSEIRLILKVKKVCGFGMSMEWSKIAITFLPSSSVTQLVTHGPPPARRETSSPAFGRDWTDLSKSTGEISLKMYREWQSECRSTLKLGGAEWKDRFWLDRWALIAQNIEMSIYMPCFRNVRYNFSEEYAQSSLLMDGSSSHGPMECLRGLFWV